MIVAIEGLIPGPSPLLIRERNPRLRPSRQKSTNLQWLRERQRQAAGEEPGDAVAAADPSLAPEPANDAPPEPNSDPNQPSLPDPIIPPPMNRVPLAEDRGFHALLDPTSSSRQPFSINRGPFRRRR